MDSQSVQSVVCVFFNMGWCKNGDGCRYVHVRTDKKIPDCCSGGHPNTNTEIQWEDEDEEDEEDEVMYYDDDLDSVS